MSQFKPLKFFHNPNSRSVSVRVLLEELGADYELHALDLKRGEQRQAPYLAINPMGKVPALLYGDTLVSELGAVFIFLADLYAHKGLAPALADEARGAYLRWLVFYGSCFEPAITDKSLNRGTSAPSSSPYGSYDDVINALTTQLGKGDYLLGARFTAADILWGVALRWITMFNLIEATPVIKAYIERVTSRPSFARTQALDAALLAAQQGAASANPNA